MPRLKLTWVSAWLPGSTALPCHSPRSHTGWEHSPRGQTQAKAEHSSLSQVIASLKINQLQSPALLVKYFPFKITLNGKRETFHKQWTSSHVSWHGLSCSLPRQCPVRGGSRREVWAAPSLPHSQSKQPEPSGRCTNLLCYLLKASLILLQPVLEETKESQEGASVGCCACLDAPPQTSAGSGKAANTNSALAQALQT